MYNLSRIYANIKSQLCKIILGTEILYTHTHTHTHTHICICIRIIQLCVGAKSLADLYDSNFLTLLVLKG